MSTLNRALAMLALTALVLGLLGAAVILGSDYEDHRGLVAALTLAIGASWIGTGLYVWWRRPENRFGALMTWVGFAWLLHAFVSANDDVAFTVAILFSHLYLAAFLHLPVESLTWIFRGLALLLPIVTWVVVHALCRSRATRPAPGDVPPGGVGLARSAAGGWEEAE